MNGTLLATWKCAERSPLDSEQLQWLCHTISVMSDGTMLDDGITIVAIRIAIYKITRYNLCQIVDNLLYVCMRDIHSYFTRT